jgi:signal transduction histidine kinase
MSVFASLTNRIFFATALVAVLSIGIAVYMVNRAVAQQADRDLQRSLSEAAELVDAYRQTLAETNLRDAKLIADLPVLKAAVDTHDPATVVPIAQKYLGFLPDADLFAIADRSGLILARLGTSDVADTALASAVTIGGSGAAERNTFWPERHGILLIKSVPILLYEPQPDVLGTLILGASLDEGQAVEFKKKTNAEIAFAVNGEVKASTLPHETWPALASVLDTRRTVTKIDVGSEEYLAYALPLAAGEQGQPVGIVLRSRTERLKFLRELHARLAGTAVVALMLATLVSYAVARTVSRPIEAITSTMREMAASGDLSRRIPMPEGRWQDEDARVLGKTFNTMTDAIQRFQREATQRERLSSLGRLSTVIAHEIRNPLMIIKTSLRSLRREDATPERTAAVAKDIDEEITRLNRIVSEVLDFARPIKFDLAAADLNALARDAVRAAGAEDGEQGHASIRLDLDPAIPPITTDAERLRQALVNVIGNALHAVRHAASPPSDGAIRLRTARIDSRRVAVTVADRGSGIAAEDLPRVFDPYFTTRRTGTGIGLAISRNIIEGLGGRITVASQRETGTEVRIELPLDAPTA